MCRGLDHDCDGTTDGAGVVDATSWYPDTDGGGFGDPEEGVVDRVPPDGYVADREDSDCDDGDAAVHAGASDSECDGIDQDCDGQDGSADSLRR